MSLDAIIAAVTEDNLPLVVRLVNEVGPQTVDWLLPLAAQELAPKSATLFLGLGATTIDQALYVACGRMHYGPFVEGPIRQLHLPMARRVAMVDLLLARGANPNAKLEQSATPLHCAAQCTGGELLVERLVAAGANVDATDDWGRTPLHFAATLDRVTCVRALMLCGAQPRLLDREDKAAYQMTESRTIKEYLAGIGLHAKAPPPELPPKPQVVAGSVDGVLAVGAHVHHRTFGDGTVKLIEGEGEDARVTVAFADSEKRLAARFLR